MILAPSRRLWLPAGLPTWRDLSVFTAGAFQRNPSGGAIKRNSGTGALIRSTDSNTTCCCSGCCGSSWTVTFSGITLTTICQTEAISSPCTPTIADVKITFGNPNVTVSLAKFTDTCVLCEFRGTIPNFVTVNASAAGSGCSGAPICSTVADLTVVYGSQFGQLYAFWSTAGGMAHRAYIFANNNAANPCASATIATTATSTQTICGISYGHNGSGGSAVLTKH